MLTYRRALVSEVREQVVNLARKSFKEVDPRIKNAFDIDVNIDVYEAMESQGSYALFIAEDQERVVGYMSMIFSESPHIIGYIQGMLDSIFVDPEYRKEKVAQNLITEAEAYASEIGCASMTIGFKYKNPHTRFCQSMGYEPDDVMFTKILEGGV